MDAHTEKNICVVAIGTHGDVLPAVRLCKRILEAVERLSVRHSCSSRLELLATPTSSSSGGEITEDIATEVSRVAVIVHGDKGNGGDDKTMEGIRDIERACMTQACTTCDGVIFNLLSLSSYSIAEKFHLPSALLCPTFPPAGPPEGFYDALAAQYPEVTDVLTRPVEALSEIKQRKRMQFDLFLWRLFLEDEGDFRERLELPSFPSLETQAEEVFPFSTFFLLPPRLTQLDLPVHCSNVLQKYCLGTPGPIAEEHTLVDLSGTRRVQEFFEDCKRASSNPRVLLICLTSTSVCALIQKDHITSLVSSTLKLGARVLFLCSDSLERDLCDAIGPLSPIEARRVLVVSGYLPLRPILQKCAAVVHTGSAGVVVDALAVGVPQVIIPLHYDNRLWGEAVEKAEVGYVIHRNGSEQTGNVEDEEIEVEAHGKRPLGLELSVKVMYALSDDVRADVSVRAAEYRQNAELDLKPLLEALRL